MKLFEEFKLSDKITLKNRVVMAPMTTWSGNDDLTVSQEELDYYKERASGVSMLITGTTFFQENGQGFAKQFYGGSDDYLDSLKSLADVIKGEGAKAILQIFHGGRMANPNDMKVVSASAVKPQNIRYGNIDDRPMPRALEESEIEEIINGFYETTLRAKKAGFDGVEIHGANTYLIQQFFSPQSNLRDDKWGGSLEKRFEFPRRIVEEVLRAKKEIEDDQFIVGYRFSPEEIEEPGITLDDTKFLIDSLCETEVDYLHISLANYDATSLRNKDDKNLIGKTLSDVINSRKPFIGVGSIYTEQDAINCLESGFDMIALGRVIVSEPKWVEKVMESKAVEDSVDLAKASDIKIPRDLLEKIKNTPGWFKVK